MKQLVELDSWDLLAQHAGMIQASLQKKEHIFRFELQCQGIQIDFSAQRADSDTLDLLLDLAEESHLKNHISSLIQGDIVNKSQNIPALHTALRAPADKPVWVNGEDVMLDIEAVRQQMRIISEEIRSGSWLGYSGKPIKSIVNIGIGGSDFGPRFCLDALADFTAPNLDYFFISDADPKAFQRVIKKLNPETTLFIISSKSFTTYETLYNAQKALDWVGNEAQRHKHFIAVTAQVEKAKEFGITQILPIWDWVGGRYSFCAAINLITCIAIGYDAFKDMLAGAHAMDAHFYERPLHENMPVMLALFGIWNINFLHHPSLVLLVYARQLELLVPYVQQLDMESNGKLIDNLGRKLNYQTGPIVWGGVGNQAQHSYYQLLCQSNHKIAADFISINEFGEEIINFFCNSTQYVLSQGSHNLDNMSEYIPGAMPINHIRLDACRPYHLGLLIALYEHKIYIQSVLWGINAFDQPGVEQAKRMSAVFLAGYN